MLPFPTIEIREPDAWEALDQAIRNIGCYQWLIFTSVNGVQNFFARCRQLRRDLRDLKGIRIATIGPASERAVSDLGLHVEILPNEFKAEGLVESLKGKVLKGTRILIPRAKVARDVLPEELRKQGAQWRCEAYQTVIPDTGREHLLELIGERPLDLIVFTSSSTVLNLADMVKPDSLSSFLPKTAVAAIGPITAKTVVELGLQVDVQPRQYSLPLLVEAILKFFSV